MNGPGRRGPGRGEGDKRRGKGRGEGERRVSR